MKVLSDLTQDEFIMAMQLIPKGKKLICTKNLTDEGNLIYDLEIKDADAFHRLSNAVRNEKRRKLSTILNETGYDIGKAASILDVSIQTVNRNMLILNLA
ncbi:MAG: hypothetical protein K8S56_09725 [Candidatus Cloacimonetes bacterium]|nr:hypothetical protein [Candidatus Cloacimonadota bacterium]